MAEPYKSGKSPNSYKWCRCMNSCGSVEQVLDLRKGTINSLHLIRELYDEEVLHVGSRRWSLTEKHLEKRKQELLVPQVPYPTFATCANQQGSETSERFCLG